MRQAQCAVKKQSKGTGLSSDAQVPRSGCHCRIGKRSSREAPNAASSTPSSRPPPRSLATERLWQHRSTNPRICEYIVKCANQTNATSRTEPREASRSPQARHRRRNYPDSARLWEAHRPTMSTMTGRLRRYEEGKCTCPCVAGRNPKLSSPRSAVDPPSGRSPRAAADHFVEQ